MFIMADKYEPISDEARMAAKLGLESATAELDGLQWDQCTWFRFDSWRLSDEGWRSVRSTRRDSVGQVERVLAHKCGTAACIAGHTVAAMVAHDTKALTKVTGWRTGIAEAAQRLLEIPDNLAWMFGGSNDLQEPVKAMFGHAAEYGEWPVVRSSALVRAQINEARAEGLVV